MNQPPAHHPNNLVPPQGTFIGSHSSRFINQEISDVYLDHYWDTQGRIRRIAFVCVHWGTSVALVQYAAGRPGPFFYHAATVGFLNIQNLGQEPEVPGALPIPMHIQNGIFYGGHFVQGLPLPWHDRLVLRRNNNGTLHYHAHLPRPQRQHGPTPPINPDGNYYWGRQIGIGTHVQGWRQLRR